MAHIRKLTNRSQAPWLVAYKDNAGRRASKTFKAKRDAEAFLSKVLAEAERFKPLNPLTDRSITLKALAERWETEQEGILKESTISRYKTCNLHWLGAFWGRSERRIKIVSQGVGQSEVIGLGR